MQFPTEEKNRHWWQNFNKMCHAVLFAASKQKSSLFVEKSQNLVMHLELNIIKSYSNSTLLKNTENISIRAP